jgi:hypothetical protein
MGNELITAMVTIATAIVGVAIVAVLVSKNAQTGSVISAAGSAFGQDLGVAVSPVTGSSLSNLGSFNNFSSNINGI